MSTEDSQPRFVVIFDGRACYWTRTRADAEEIRSEIEKASPLTEASLTEKLREGKPFLLHDPTEGRVEEINDRSLYCLTHSNTRLLFGNDGWMPCPECGRTPYYLP